MSPAEKRIKTIPAHLYNRLVDLPDDLILAVHDLMHREMLKRHGKEGDAK